MEKKVVNVGLNLDAIPGEMKEFDQWVIWQAVERDNGKIGKVPWNHLAKRQASVTDSSTWLPFWEVEQFQRNWKQNVCGFVFSEGDPYIGIDLDDCIDPETNEVEVWARELVTELNSYAEVSPSGKGLHVIIKGNLPEGRRRSGQVEMYDKGRFFTMTGSRLEGTPAEIRDCVEIDEVYNCIFAEKEDVQQTVIESYAEAINEAERVGLFDKLYGGDWSDYTSQSEADLALCAMLARKTGGDLAEMDRMFRDSGLYSEKWERDDYRKRTLEKALASINQGKQEKSTNKFNLTDLGTRRG